MSATGARILFALALAFSCAAAHASPADSGQTAVGLRAEPTAIPLVDAGSGRVDISAEVSLTLREVGAPISLAPDLYMGFAHGLTVGLYHSTRAAGLLDSGSGLCLRSQDDGCVDRFSGTGLDLLRPLWAGRGARLVARVRTDVTRWKEPTKVRWAPGLVASIRGRRFSALADPHVAFGVTNLDRGNPIRLHIPIWLGVRLGPADLALRTGLDGPIQGFSDSWAVPMGLALGTQIGARWRVEIFAVLPKIGGPLNSERPRDISLRASVLAW